MRNEQETTENQNWAEHVERPKGVMEFFVSGRPVWINCNRDRVYDTDPTIPGAKVKIIKAKWTRDYARGPSALFEGTYLVNQWGERKDG